MLHTYNHKFWLRKGSQVFVPTEKSSEFGLKLCKWLFRRWTPPTYYYHLRDGGHVAAARKHSPDRIFVRLDLESFFNSVTRSRVARSLKRVGFKTRDAFHFASHSTVEKTPGTRDFSLPFGFPQSPALASLVLADSALGKALDRLEANPGTYRVSVYMDDIIISADSVIALDDALAELLAASDVCGLKFNLGKKEGPAPKITAFNIHISQSSLVITDERMAEFETALRVANENQAAGILNYVASVNTGQAAFLLSTLPP